MKVKDLIAQEVDIDVYEFCGIMTVALQNPYRKEADYDASRTAGIKWDRHDVLECEKIYKEKLQSIQFGLNDN